ncbi:phosphoribosylaminoimidazolesuccinocarboxamide synthase [Ignavibacterium sp.]|uniref:phosphoribosylaminoimidazolesuccinocarboxamide synthase n=1 Tax=Ignavibacterium sp. TaxID=2651167 RepID=UPI00307EBA5F
MHPKVILQTNFTELKLIKRGKVRDIYEVGEYLLIVSTDRISAFDVIMNQGIPYKGIILTKISEFWFNFVQDIIPNHLITTKVEEFPDECKPYSDDLRGRSMLVKKTEVIPIESVVRGYITGSGMIDYQATGSICGIKLPPGLVESEKLSEPIFTPATKEELGAHDQNISEEEAKKVVGDDVISFIKEKTIALYRKAYEYALKKGIIIADTKMEFGKYNGEIILIDELLTPDSSRFWPADKYQKGRVQESFDKQFLRNYLISINFNRKPPAPDLPDEIIYKTTEKYLEALAKLTGQKI